MKLLLFSILNFSFSILLVACQSSEPGPQPTPTPLLAPYDHAIATAEAGGDMQAQAAAYYERGNLQLDNGAFEAAIVDYDRSLALDPQQARALHNRGLAYAALQQPDRALADYSAAIS